MSYDVRGKTVVLTGTFSKLKRAEAEAKLAALGAKIGGSVGKSTDVLFAGAAAGSKIDRASALGVRVLTEDDLMAVLAGPSAGGPSPFTTLDPSLDGDALAALIAALPWDALLPDRDLPPLRLALWAHEAKHGITAAHREATRRLRPLAVLTHGHGHQVEIGWSDVSPDGRHLATGSWVGDDYNRGGHLLIWDVEAGRCVNRMAITGGVGWPDYGGCVQWRPDGKRVGLAFDTNGVGSFNPFSPIPEWESVAYVTDGWSRPPDWCWSGNNRDALISCWGPKDHTRLAVVTLLERHAKPRWLFPTHADGDLLSWFDWTHPDRILAHDGETLHAVTPAGDPLWQLATPGPISVHEGGAALLVGGVVHDAATGRLRPEPLRPDAPAPTFGVVACSGFRLTFTRPDGSVSGDFQPAVESSGESALPDSAWSFPVDAARAAVALPEGVVVSADATAAEIDGKIAWVVDRKWAWPWRWGEAVVWPDLVAACKDPAAPAWLKRQYKKAAPPKASKAAWPPPGGDVSAVVQLLEPMLRGINDSYHGGEKRALFAERTMRLGMFDVAARAIDDWGRWQDPWFSAYGRGLAALAAFDGRTPTDAQRDTLRRWLDEAEAQLPGCTGPCRIQAVVGAARVLLGETARGQALLKTAIAGIDPEPNETQNRAVVAVALAAVSQREGAAIHLTSSPNKPSWVEAPQGIQAIVARASPTELMSLHTKLRKKGGQNEFVLLDRGLERLIALRAWDAAEAWLGGFPGLSTSVAKTRLLEALIAAGEPPRLSLADSDLSLAALARLAPDLARPLLLERAAKLEESLPSYGADDFARAFTETAVRVGELALAERAIALSEGQVRHAAHLGLLAGLDPSDPTWDARLAAAEPGPNAEGTAKLAALASAAGRPEAAARLVDVAIEQVRGEQYSDIHLEYASRHLAAVGDLTNAHRLWLAMPKGRRAIRNQPLLDACRARGLWEAVADLLRQMPTDLNGAPQQGMRLLLEATGRTGW